jgi:hypothetical protein
LLEFAGKKQRRCLENHRRFEIRDVQTFLASEPVSEFSVRVAFVPAFAKAPARQAL